MDREAFTGCIIPQVSLPCSHIYLKATSLKGQALPPTFSSYIGAFPRSNINLPPCAWLATSLELLLCFKRSDIPPVLTSTRAQAYPSPPVRSALELKAHFSSGSQSAVQTAINLQATPRSQACNYLARHLSLELTVPVPPAWG